MRPQVVVPVIADQPFWAGRVAEAGIGFPRPISAYDITIKDLAEMIFHVSTDPEVRRAAEAARTEVQQVTEAHSLTHHNISNPGRSQTSFLVPYIVRTMGFRRGENGWQRARLVRTSLR